MADTLSDVEREFQAKCGTWIEVTPSELDAAIDAATTDVKLRVILKRVYRVLWFLRQNNIR